MQMRQLAACLCRPNLKISCKSEQLGPVDGGWGRDVRLLSEEINRSSKDKSSTHLSLKLRGCMPERTPAGDVGKHTADSDLRMTARHRMGWDHPSLPTFTYSLNVSESHFLPCNKDCYELPGMLVIGMNRFCLDDRSKITHMARLHVKTGTFVYGTACTLLV